MVEVQENQVAVNTEQSTIQGVLTAEQIDTLPINGRNFLDLAQLEPGVQIQDGGNFDPTKNGFSSISFGGRFGRTARIEVDGLDISDETVSTTTQNIPASSIQEFQVQQSSLDISTELTSSGSVNVTTKSGTNSVHGGAYYSFRDHTLDADLPGGSSNYFQRNQFGGDVGGPIIKNEMFFFVDAERTKQDLLNPVLSSGPFSAITGSYDSPFRESEISGKLDWLVKGKYKLFYKFTYNENRSVLAIIPNSFQPFANKDHTPSHAIGLDFNTGSYTHSIRFGYMKFRNAIVDATAGSSIFDPLPGIELAIGSDPDCLTSGADFFCFRTKLSGAAANLPDRPSDQVRREQAAGSAYFAIWRRPEPYFWRRICQLSGAGPGGMGGVLDCGTACQTLPGGLANPLNYPANNVTLGNGQGYDSEIPAFGFPAGGSGPDNRLSAYFEDDWKAKPNLTVKVGLRWYVRDTGPHR